MAKKETTNPKNEPSFAGPRHRPRWAWASFCLLLATLLTVAFVSYAPEQNPEITTHPTQTNPVGKFGIYASYLSFMWIGLSTWLLPFFFFWMGYLLLRSARRLAAARCAAMVICIFCMSALADMQNSFFKSHKIIDPQVYSSGAGGSLGQILYNNILSGLVGPFGSGLILATVYGLGLLFIFTRDIAAEFDKAIFALHSWRNLRAAAALKRSEEKELLAKQKSDAKVAAAAAAKVELKGPLPPPPSGQKFTLPKPAKTSLASTDGEPTVPTPAPVPAARPAVRPASVTAPATDTKALAVATGKLELNIVKPAEPKKAKINTVAKAEDDYQFPPLSILKDQVKPSASNSEEEHARNAENLLRILSEFGVEVSLGEIHVGPVITRYEVIPAPGVRVEKIAGLDKNIALGMRAQSVRILAPIPGKAAVGVEVPNLHPTPVGMREILESEDWGSAKAELPIALGKDVSGKPLISDLTKMPHLLIAGATGSGKSVCINSIVASILYSASPKNVRLIMVDPKVVELKVFNSLPHMLIPLATEPKKVPAAIKWLLTEMEQRYQIFAKVNVRNIVGFNGRKKNVPVEPPLEAQAQLGVVPRDDEIEIPQRLPYIVAIIDELADLMMVAPAEIETSIARLAQLARAAGIHLIIATQRPSVNVITGVIKANLPSRIAFQVPSPVDSRTILDTKGADALIGRGDMLFSPPGTSRLVRAQGAFVSDEEVQGLVEFLKRNGPPQYAHTVQQQIDRAAREDEDGDAGEGDSDLG